MGRVLHIEGPEGAFAVELSDGAAPVTIGRGEDAQVRLQDKKKQISRKHLTLQWGDAGGRLTVIGQLACTVRGEVLASGASTHIAAGDLIVVGDFRLVVKGAGEPATMPPAAPPAQQATHALHAHGVGNARLNDFLATPAAAVRAAPTFTQWSRARPAGAAPAAAPPHAPPAAVPGLDSPARRPADLLNKFIAPAAERVLEDRAPRPDRSVAWAPADTPAPSTAGPAPAAFAPAPAPAVDVAPAAVAPAVAARSAEPRREPGPGVLSGWIAPSGAQAPAIGPADVAGPPAQVLSAWGIAEPPVAAPVPVRAPVPAPAPAPEAPVSARHADLSATHVHAAAATADAGRAPAAAAAQPGRADAERAQQCLTALAAGLGIGVDAAEEPEEWQRLGVTLRLLVDGLRLMLSDRKSLRSELRVPDPTQFYYSDNNPLKTDMALHELVAILMSSPETLQTYLPFDDSVQEAVDDLRSHNLAIIAAARATVVGVLQEFDPQRLRASLSGAKESSDPSPEGAPSLLERGRLWKAYAERYQSMNANPADWIERVFDRHFVGAYSREAARRRSR